MSSSPEAFGPYTLIAEWDHSAFEDMLRAQRKGNRAMRDIVFRVVQEGPDTGWGGLWLAVSLPRHLFMEVMALYADSGGNLSLAHVVHDYLYSLAADGGWFRLAN